MVDVSPDECLNSTDDTKRKRGGCIFHELCCCNDNECVRYDAGIHSDMLPAEDPTTIVDEPFAAGLGFNVSASVLCPSLAISLFVVVELLDRDSPRGGCNELHNAATGRVSKL